MGEVDHARRLVDEDEGKREQSIDAAEREARDDELRGHLFGHILVLEIMAERRCYWASSFGRRPLPLHRFTPAAG
jgi:hypothetical protein